MRLTFWAKRATKLLGGTALVLAVLWAIVPSGFLGRPHSISPDTMTYANGPGLSIEFFGSPGFVTIRTPGFGLFLYIVTLGNMPRPEVIRFCDPKLDPSGSCDTFMAKLGADMIVSRVGPQIFAFTKQTDMLFGRAVTAARLLTLLSFGFLLAVLARRLGFLLAAACVAVVLRSYLNQDTVIYQDILQTEILFPSVLLLYVCAMLEYIATRRIAWIYAATIIAIFAFLVRPAFIYIPILHLSAAMFIAIQFRDTYAAAGSGALVAITLAWFVLWSPTQFFSTANVWSNQLRTAVISDQSTVDCVSDPESKLILGAYLHSIKDDTHFPVDPNRPKNYFRRYYDLVGSWKVNLPWHPIYREPGIGALVDATGALPDGTIRSMLAAARKCNFWRNLSYSLFNVEFMVGLRTVRGAPYDALRHYFFQSPKVFVVCAPMILIALFGALRRRDNWYLFLIGLPLLIYFGTVFVVALLQGGETRYSFVVEPLFVLSAAAAAAATIGKFLRVAVARRQLLKDQSVRWFARNRKAVAWAGAGLALAILLAVGRLALQNEYIRHQLYRLELSLRGEPDILVDSASYGVNCQHFPVPAPYSNLVSSGNATREVQAACDGERECTFEVAFALFADPAHGCGKEFVAEYRCADKPMTSRRAFIPLEALGKPTTLSCGSLVVPR